MLPLLISLSTANDAEVRQYSAYALVKIAQNAEVRKVVTEEVLDSLYEHCAYYIQECIFIVLILCVCIYRVAWSRYCIWQERMNQRFNVKYFQLYAPCPLLMLIKSPSVVMAD